MPISLYIATAATGSPLLDATPFVQSCQLATNSHGCQSIDLELNRNLYDAFRLYDAPGTLHIEMNDGAQILGATRLEDPGLHAGAAGAAKLNALGYQRTLSDIPYTALWSDTSWQRWRPVANTELTNRTPERYDFRTENNILEIAPKKGETFGGNAGPAPQPAIGSYLYVPPSGGGRQITLVQFDLELLAPANWKLVLYGLNSTYTSFTSVYTITSAGAAITRSVFASLTANDRLMFDLYLDTVGTTTASFDTGTTYARISNMRICTTLTNIVNTPLTANRAAGASVTATVATTANMYIGQRLTMNSTGNPSESIVVQSITNSTQFVATFVNSYTTGQPVGGCVVYADEIVRDLVNVVSGVNSSQLSSATSGITSPGRDIVDAVYEDQYPDELVTALAATGNSSNAAYEWGVDDQRRVFFRLQGSRATTWYVDIDDLELSRSLDGLRNSGYAVYENTTGDTVRSAVSTNSTSVLRYGLTRRQAIDVQTTNSTYATGVRDTTIAANVTVQPRASFTVRAVYNSVGARYPIGYVRANDIMIIRNLPPTASAAVDTVRTFRISRTVYDPLAGTLQIEPEAPDPTLEALVGGQV